MLAGLRQAAGTRLTCWAPQASILQGAASGQRVCLAGRPVACKLLRAGAGAGRWAASLVQAADLTDLTVPASWYPAARLINRVVTAHVGPPNSGGGSLRAHAWRSVRTVSAAIEHVCVCACGCVQQPQAEATHKLLDWCHEIPADCAGKTHAALEALKAAQNGVYCGPLRLLAWEVCSLLQLWPPQQRATAGSV